MGGGSHHLSSVTLSKGTVDGVGDSKVSEVLDDALVLNLVGGEVGSLGQGGGVVDLENVGLVGDLCDGGVIRMSVRCSEYKMWQGSIQERRPCCRSA